MKLKETIAAAALQRGSTCTIKLLMARLSKQDVAELVECLADERYTHAQIARGMTAEGHKLSQNIVQRHRKGDCNCDDR